MVIGINRNALETNEQELQNTITYSVAEEIKLYDSSQRQQLQTLLKTLEPTDPKAPFWDLPYIRSTLKQFYDSNPNLLYVTLLNEQATGIQYPPATMRNAIPSWARLCGGPLPPPSRTSPCRATQCWYNAGPCTCQ